MNFFKKLQEKMINLEKAESVFLINWKFFLVTILSFIIITGITAIAVFFFVVKSPEKVLVPNVVGKELTEALQEMQVKELYPKIQMRYSDTNEDKGFVLDQSPSAGTITKANKRIELVISQGAVLDRVGDYIGMDIEDLRTQLSGLFASSSIPLIQIPDVIMYKNDIAPQGTILEQNPPANTKIARPVTLELVVSAGKEVKGVRVPNITGLSLNDALLQLNRNKITFMFTAQEPKEGEEPGVVVSQKWPVGEEFVPQYTRIDSVITIPSSPVDDLMYGILDYDLPKYPYALKIELIASPPEGDDYSIVSFYHTGNNITIPYAVPVGTRLILNAQGNEVTTFVVQ